MEVAPDILEALENALYALRARDEDFDQIPAYVEGAAIVARATGRAT